MVPSKVHTTMLKTRVLQNITYVFPLMRFIFTDNTVSTLNLVTWAWVGNDGTIIPGVTTTTPAPAVTPALTYSLNGTGVNFFADNVSVNQPASIAADNGEFPRQDGRYPRPFSFTKVSDYGVQDNNTGLMWELKANSGPRNKDLKFSHSEAVEYVNTVNGLALGGFTDWRLPTADELFGIVDLREKPFQAAGLQLTIDQDYFTDMPSLPSLQNSDLQFWTGERLAAIASDLTYFYVSFIGGGVAQIDTSQYYFSVRLVRGATVPRNQFVITDGGLTVTDNATGLMWKREFEMNVPGDPVPWAEAVTATARDHDWYVWQDTLKRAVTDRTAGYSDWRVPNVKEMVSFIDHDLGDSIDLTQGGSVGGLGYIHTGISGDIFPCVKNLFTNIEGATWSSPLSGAYFWTSTPLPFSAIRLSNVRYFVYSEFGTAGATRFGGVPETRRYVWLCRTPQTTTPAPVSTTTTTPAPAQAYVASGFVDPGYVV